MAELYFFLSFLFHFLTGSEIIGGVVCEETGGTAATHISRLLVLWTCSVLDEPINGHVRDGLAIQFLGSLMILKIKHFQNEPKTKAKLKVEAKYA